MLFGRLINNKISEMYNEHGYEHHRYDIETNCVISTVKSVDLLRAQYLMQFLLLIDNAN